MYKSLPKYLRSETFVVKISVQKAQERFRSSLTRKLIIQNKTQQS